MATYLCFPALYTQLARPEHCQLASFDGNITNSSSPTSHAASQNKAKMTESPPQINGSAAFVPSTQPTTASVTTTKAPTHAPPRKTTLSTTTTPQPEVTDADEAVTSTDQPDSQDMDLELNELMEKYGLSEEDMQILTDHPEKLEEFIEEKTKHKQKKGKVNGLNYLRTIPTSTEIAFQPSNITRTIIYTSKGLFSCYFLKPIYVH